LSAKIRFRTGLKKCRVSEIFNNEVSVEFEEAVFAPAAGQFCVFYDNDICLGGGEIV